ncbi:acetoacetate metabolism regulatory protein AtoC [Geothrix limicola]|uniref:Acetoacetate metabolism regulatory protein AtoC n=1 Tax=Geothrix limicola TaxID=2927978 RepID=A0ABQ5QKY3_9BACT|nr:sigma-54 dependent transcriptional regulator [Geothrix limicola]GLH74961.1 acetoacetate metabolism regulatory protein AtoC [Geothrix limicola]
MTRILVVDDDLAIREMVAMTLEKSGYRVERTDGFAAARAAIREQRPDLIVSDIYMPGGTGLDLLEEVRALPDPPPMILMTAKGSIETAASAMKDGVFDYLAKPFDLDLMLERVRAALASRMATLPAEEEGPESLIVGSHPAIVEVYKATSRVAPLRVPVLILGETGTGKELVARALHRYGSNPQGPFVPVHCGAIPDTLIESELFGHKKGAFTDAQRDRRGALVQGNGGTVFLDEIGDISPMFQVKLLRFLEDGVVLPLGAEKPEPVSVRIVAATHRDLKTMVAEGRFREDLFYRLAGYEIKLPPLRERLSDLSTLVAHFQKRFQAELGLADTGRPSQEVLSLLAAHPWPGNIRELGHVIRRALIEAGSLEDGHAIQKLLGTAAFPEGPTGGSMLALNGFAEPFLPLDDMERLYILSVLAHTGGNKTEAARILGIERKTLARKLRRTEGSDVEDPEGGES